MAAFVLAMIVNDFTNGQEAALQGNLISNCLEQLGDANAKLRQWLALCLGKVSCTSTFILVCGGEGYTAIQHAVVLVCTSLNNYRSRICTFAECGMSPRKWALVSVLVWVF